MEYRFETYNDIVELEERLSNMVNNAYENGLRNLEMNPSPQDCENAIRDLQIVLEDVDINGIITSAKETYLDSFARQSTINIASRLYDELHTYLQEAISHVPDGFSKYGYNLNEIESIINSFTNSISYYDGDRILDEFEKTLSDVEREVERLKNNISGESLYEVAVDIESLIDRALDSIRNAKEEYENLRHEYEKRTQDVEMFREKLESIKSQAEVKLEEIKSVCKNIAREYREVASMSAPSFGNSVTEIDSGDPREAIMKANEVIENALERSRRAFYDLPDQPAPNECKWVLETAYESLDTIKGVTINEESINHPIIEKVLNAANDIYLELERLEGYGDGEEPRWVREMRDIIDRARVNIENTHYPEDAIATLEAAIDRIENILPNNGDYTYPVRDQIEESKYNLEEARRMLEDARRAVETLDEMKREAAQEVREIIEEVKDVCEEMASTFENQAL